MCTYQTELVVLFTKSYLEKNYTRAVDNLYAEKILSRTKARNRNRSPEKKSGNQQRPNHNQAGPSTSAPKKGNPYKGNQQQKKRVPNNPKQQKSKGNNPWNPKGNKPAQKRQDLLKQLFELTKTVKALKD
jgi:hypothetical protein